MEEKESLARMNLVNLVGLGKIKEEDLELTEQEKEEARVIKEQTEKLKEMGVPVVWSTPID